MLHVRLIGYEGCCSRLRTSGVAFESQRMSKIALLAIEADEAQTGEALPEIEGAGQVPQIGALHPSESEHLDELLGQRSVRMDPADPGQQRRAVGLDPLTGEGSAQLRLEQVGRYEA